MSRAAVSEVIEHTVTTQTIEGVLATAHAFAGNAQSTLLLLPLVLTGQIFRLVGPSGDVWCVGI